MSKFVTTLEVENLKGIEFEKFYFYDTLSYDAAGAWGRVLVTGENGASKTSLKDALIFALTGLDGSGSTSAPHLLRNGSESLKVTIGLEGGLMFHRSLTQKGNGSIRVCKPYDQTVTASDFRKMMGYNEDLAMCAIIPGHLMSQSEDARRKLIIKATGTLFRKNLVAEFVGVPESWVTSKFGDIDEALPTVSKVYVMRLDLRKKLLAHEVDVKALEQIISQVPVEPEPLTEEFKSEEKAILAESSQMASYQKDMAHYFEKKSAHAALTVEFDKFKARKDQLLKDLGSLFDVSPVAVDWGEYDRVKGQVRSVDKPRELQKLPEADTCFTCGQIIGIGHRRKMDEERCRAETAYQIELMDVDNHNRALQIILSRLHETNKRAEKLNEEALRTNAHNKLTRKWISEELAHLKPPTIPLEPEMPQALVRKYSDDDLKKRAVTIEKHYKRLGVYESHCAEKDEALKQIDQARKELEELRTELYRYETFEQALRDMPVIEYIGRLKKFGIDLEGVEITRDVAYFDLKFKGTPYTSLSTGERLRVDLALCKKFHELLDKNPECKLPKVIFLDNADLCDWALTKYLDGYQFFSAHVAPWEPLKVTQGRNVTTC